MSQRYLMPIKPLSLSMRDTGTSTQEMACVRESALSWRVHRICSVAYPGAAWQHLRARSATSLAASAASRAASAVDARASAAAQASAAAFALTLAASS